MKRAAWRSISVTVLVVLALLLVATLALLRQGFDYDLSLPEGYRLVRVHACEVALCDPENKGVIEGVETYGVVGSIVVGVERTGYFVLDTRTGELSSSLDEQGLVQVLGELGVNRKPRLRRPTRPLW